MRQLPIVPQITVAVCGGVAGGSNRKPFNSWIVDEIIAEFRMEIASMAQMVLHLLWLTCHAWVQVSEACCL